MSPRRASAPCQREVSLDRLLEVAQAEVVARMFVGSHPGIGHSAMRMFGSWHCVLTASMRKLSLVKARQWIS